MPTFPTQPHRRLSRGKKGTDPTKEVPPNPEGQHRRKEANYPYMGSLPTYIRK